MRPLIYIVIPILASTVATRATLGQVLRESTVPAAVRRGYASNFPGARKTEWKLRSDKNYEAEFELKGVGIAAKFDSTGALLETESDINSAQVPPAVGRTIAQTFKAYKIVERQRLESRGGPVLYEIHLENGTEVIKAQFDSSGSLVSRSSKPRQRTSLHPASISR